MLITLQTPLTHTIKTESFNLSIALSTPTAPGATSYAVSLGGEGEVWSTFNTLGRGWVAGCAVGGCAGGTLAGNWDEGLDTFGTDLGVFIT